MVGNVIEMKVSEGLEAFDGCLKSGVGGRPKCPDTGPSVAVVEALRMLRSPVKASRLHQGHHGALAVQIVASGTRQGKQNAFGHSQ